jgi:hypothetical protein
MRAQNISTVDLLKIDVETHEPEVLAGMEEYLPSMLLSLLIEILTDEIGAKVERLLRGKGYCYYAVDEEKGLIRTGGLSIGLLGSFLICTPEKAKTLRLR